jgi:hypothetical protein
MSSGPAAEVPEHMKQPANWGSGPEGAGDA